MPDFTVRGNPGAIRARATTTSEKGQSFFATGEALSKIDVSGWTGRAADHFREAHDLEPDRWIAAGNGFVRAGNALGVYASAVERVQEVAHWAEGEYARGEQVTQDARAAYDADVARGREQQARSIAHGIPFDLTIVPFDDPGQAIRDNALAELAKARSELEAAAHTCAAEVRAGCAAAPEKPNWFESGLRFVGGIFEGAGEAVWDLLTLSPFSLVNMVDDGWKLVNGDLTPEELMDKYELSLETVEGMWDALRHDPLEFGKNLGKGLLDWDTWSDDPARALGHLVPDAVVAALTAGTGGVAARGAHAGADGLEALADMRRADGALDGLSHLDDLGGARQLDRLVPGGDRLLADGTTHTPRWGPGDLQGLDEAADVGRVLDAHGWSSTELDAALHTPVEELTGAQRHLLTEVRDAAEIRSTTVMQKVVPDSAADALVDGTSRFPVDTQAGFMARAADVADATTPQRLFDDLALDYQDSPFRAPGQDALGPMSDGVVAQDHMTVLRFEAGDPGDYVVPRHSALGGDGTWDSAAVKSVTEDPFTGTGWTHGDHPVPEVTTKEPVELAPGSEMWRVDASGDQELVAVLKRVDGEPVWVKLR